MSERKIDSKMIETLRQNSKNDDVIADFLIDLIYEEVDNSPAWHWKNVYKNKLRHYSEKWRNKNAD